MGLLSLGAGLRSRSWVEHSGSVVWRAAGWPASLTGVLDMILVLPAVGLTWLHGHSGRFLEDIFVFFFFTSLFTEVHFVSLGQRLSNE